METKVVYETPDSTYFSMSNVAPKIEGDVIALTDGQGTRRSWGAPQTTSTVVFSNCEFVAVHVGFSHKHRGSQGWFYFVNADTGPARKTWAQLTEDEQDLVLANADKAPRWAKSPGVRKAERKAASTTTFTGYKVMRVTDGMRSLYDDTAWEIGKRNGQAVSPQAGTDDWTGETLHDGGFYVHTDMRQVKELFEARTLAPARCFTPGAYALVECECSGRVARFSNGKLAVTYCRPVTIVETFSL
jgi:hypothetical protein